MSAWKGRNWLPWMQSKAAIHRMDSIAIAKFAEHLTREASITFRAQLMFDIRHHGIAINGGEEIHVPFIYGDRI